MAQLLKEKPTGRSHKAQKMIDEIKKDPKSHPEISKFSIPQSHLLDTRGNLPKGEELRNKFIETFAEGVITVPVVSGLPWVETRWHGGLTGSLQCKNCKYDVNAAISAPDIQSVENDAKDCAIEAGAISLINAVLADPAAAAASFLPTFKSCMVSKGFQHANDITVSLSVDSDCGDYHDCL